jgi:3-oxoacyl-[acyl-carrier-protein] synthase-3
LGGDGAAENREMKAYITSMGKFLPGEPIDNDSMEEYLGRIGGKPSRVRARILKQNGIQTRHYAIDRQQKTLFSNAEMAARAAQEAICRAAVDLGEIDFLAAATSQGDFPLPGFASMVHAELGAPPCEIATLHGVCASGVMALKSAMLQILSGGKNTAVACASEFASRLFKSTRFEAQAKVRDGALGFDTEFLRWMLSDGAGAAVVRNLPASRGLCFEIEWIELKSFANQFEPCMYVGPEKNGHQTKTGPRIASWLDYPSYHAAADDGAINLRQDVRMLGDVVRCAVQGLLEIAGKTRLDPARIDWLVAHYSSHVFRDESHELAARAGFEIPCERWFTNLYTRGNVGSASVFVLLEDLLHSGKLEPGQTVLSLVPESGRFLFGYMLLKVVEASGPPRPAQQTVAALPRTEPPQLETGSDPLAQSLVRQLALVWFDFESSLRRVPIVAKLYGGNFTTEDYKALLFNLRQQVIDGSRWIARAASSITADYFPIRSAFIGHTGDEHRDFEMLERNYAAVGGNLDEIRKGRKNIGSEALSAYMLQRASEENPFELIGAMFIVEGLGNRIARQWGERIQDQLGLGSDAVSFFLYHSESDVKHFRRLDLAIGAGILTERLVAEIVRCAKVTARLYALQLEEIGHF